MVRVISDNREQLDQLCRRFNVRRLSVFGSAVREDFDESASDLDFVVEFGRVDPIERKEDYFGLLSALARLFGRDVDLIELPAVRNPFVRRRILEQQETVYDAA